MQIMYATWLVLTYCVDLTMCPSSCCWSVASIQLMRTGKQVAVQQPLEGPTSCVSSFFVFGCFEILAQDVLDNFLLNCLWQGAILFTWVASLSPSLNDLHSHKLPFLFVYSTGCFHRWVLILVKLSPKYVLVISHKKVILNSQNLGVADYLFLQSYSV